MSVHLDDASVVGPPLQEVHIRDDSSEDSFEYAQHVSRQLSPSEDMPPSSLPYRAAGSDSRKTSTNPSQENGYTTPGPYELPPLQTNGNLDDFDQLDPIYEDDPSSYDLVAPAYQNGTKEGYSLEKRSQALFSREHLQVIFSDPALLLKFTSFLGVHRPKAVPALIHYLDALKSLRALHYANAILQGLEHVDGLDSTETQIPPSRNQALESRADAVFDYLVKEELPAYITYQYIKVVSASISARISGSLAPHLREASEGLAEVFCLTDPSRPDNPIVFASEEFNRTTQYGMTYILGKNCRFLQGPETNPTSVRRIRDATKAGIQQQEVFLNYRRDGSPFMNLLMTAPLCDSRGQVRYFIGAQVDVSGLVKESSELQGFQRLLEMQARGETIPDPQKPAPEKDDELRELSEMLNQNEMSTIRRYGGKMHRESRDDDNESLSSQPRLMLRDPQTITPPLKDSSGKLSGVYQHYLLVRPYPSLRVLFASPSQRLPGILQSPFMNKIGGSNRVREELTAALAEGRGVTAKVRWVSRTDDEGGGRNKWIHCTPLVGSNGNIGVWMVVIVDDEKNNRKYGGAGRQAPPVRTPERSQTPGKGSAARSLNSHPYTGAPASSHLTWTVSQPYGTARTAQRAQHNEAVALESLQQSASSAQAAQDGAPSSRHPYRRQASWTSPSTQYQHIPLNDRDIAELNADDERTAARAGLGVSGIPQSPPRLRRVPVGSKDNIPEDQEFPDVFLSPQVSHGEFSQTTTAQNTPGKAGASLSVKWSSPESSRYSLRESEYQHIASDVNLVDHDHSFDDGCPTQGDILNSQWSWFSITIVFLAIYSTLFSGVLLGIAFVKPRWGQRIGTQGHLSFSTASLLSALFSKTIELSFVTVVVATLGQILSRKAFVKPTYLKTKGGISIAEMNMRLWIMQPGTLLTNWIGVRYALTTMLGAFALVAAVSAIFYTTAAEALVAPKLKFGKNETRLLSGKVAASFANSIYLQQNCQTPISTITDPPYAGPTCLQIEHAGQGFHNFNTWIIDWAARIARLDTPINNGSFIGRPDPVAILFDNTTVRGQWIISLNDNNITENSKKHGRLFQNVTMAMPHANVVHAARDHVNRILQPGDLQEAGEYYVKASVPAPAINVLCAGMSLSEIQPLIVNNDTKLADPWPVKTPLDTPFGWTQNPTIEGGESAPLFAKLPIAYNTVVNTTVGWGPAAIYLLAKPPPAITTNDYVLCSLKSAQYPNCTTAYHVAQSGGQLSVHCNQDPENTFPYLKTEDKAPTGVWEHNWKDVGTDWIEAVALGQGVSDSNASIARMVTQMIPAYSPEQPTYLDSSSPSIGEALSVLAGCTLLLSSDAAPFIHFWNYSDSVYILKDPQYQSFPALVSYKDYASGGTQPWQGVFYIILVSVFALNCFCLIYLFWIFGHDGQVTDYTEPQNLFALAMNSPPSSMLAGACGGGPSGDMLGKKWLVSMSRPAGSSSTEDPVNRNLNQYQSHHGSPLSKTTTTGYQSHPHFSFRCPDDLINDEDDGRMMHPTELLAESPASRRRKSLRRFGGFNTGGAGGSRGGGDDDDAVRKSSRNRSGGGSGDEPYFQRLRSVRGFSVDESPAVKQYMKLVDR